MYDQSMSIPNTRHNRRMARKYGARITMRRQGDAWDYAVCDGVVIWANGIDNGACAVDGRLAIVRAGKAAMLAASLIF